MKKKHKLGFGLLTLALCLLPAYQGLAAFDAFLKIGGIAGESTDATHPNEIVVLSFSWGMPQTAGSVTNAWYLKIDKMIDKSSPLLYVCSAGGSNLNQVVLTVRKAGHDQQEYLIIKLTDVLVSSVLSGGGATDVAAMPMEEISFSFASIEWTYQAFAADGTPSGPPIVTSWGNTAILPAVRGSPASKASPQ